MTIPSWQTLKFFDAGLDDDVAEHRHLLGDAFHVTLAVPGRHFESGLGQPLAHVWLVRISSATFSNRVTISGGVFAGAISAV